MRKNFIALFFTMLLVGVVVSCSDNVDFDENQSDEVLNSNISSSDLLMNLERSFLPATRANAALDHELYVYPDYYCGNYMKGDKVVILVKGDKVDVYRDDLVDRCKANNFEIETREHSMNEILNIRDRIVGVGESVLNQLGVCFWGIDPENNCLEVVLEDTSIDKINRFKSVVGDFSILKFSQGSKVTFDAEVSPGKSFYENQGKGYGSIGFRCTYGGKQGFFITSGHVMKSVMNKLYSGMDFKECLGVCRNCDEKGIDAAVCEVEKGVNLTNSFTFKNKTITLGTSVGTSSKLSPIGLKGRHNSSEGTVELVGTGFPGRSYLYFSAGQYASQGGDSGGIIFNTKENKVVGIHMARAKKDNVVYSFYVPYSAIENKFGIRLY